MSCSLLEWKDFAAGAETSGSINEQYTPTCRPLTRCGVGVPVTVHSTATSDRVCGAARPPGENWILDLVDLRVRVGEVARAVNAMVVTEHVAEESDDEDRIGWMRLVAVGVAGLYSACATYMLVVGGSKDGDGIDEMMAASDDEEMMIHEEAGAPRLPPCRYSADSCRSKERRSSTFRQTMRASFAGRLIFGEDINSDENGACDASTCLGCLDQTCSYPSPQFLHSLFDFNPLAHACMYLAMP